VAVGAGVGVSLGVLLIALMIAFFFLWRKHNKKKAVELPGSEGAGVPPTTAASSLLPLSASPRKGKGGAYTASTLSSPNTMYTNSAIEEGGMNALAAGRTGLGVSGHTPGNGYIVNPIGGEIHEIDPGNRIHEMSVPDERHELHGRAKEFR
jgi:hypothetical protein